MKVRETVGMEYLNMLDCLIGKTIGVNWCNESIVVMTEIEIKISNSKLLN